MAAVEDHGIVAELPVEVGPEDREDVVDRFYYSQADIVDSDRIQGGQIALALTVEVPDRELHPGDRFIAVVVRDIGTVLKRLDDKDREVLLLLRDRGQEIVYDDLLVLGRGHPAQVLIELVGKIVVGIYVYVGIPVGQVPYLVICLDAPGDGTHGYSLENNTKHAFESAVVCKSAVCHSLVLLFG